MTAPAMTTTDGSPSFGADTIKTALYGQALEAYRSKNVFRAASDIRVDESDVPVRGNPIQFTKINALAVQTAALSETADPTHLAITPATVTISLVEYGATTKPTKKLRLTSFLNIPLVATGEVASNMEESLDIVARNVLNAGTNVQYVGQTSRAAITAANTLAAANIRRARNFLAKNNSPFPMSQAFGAVPGYIGIIHPDPGYDLRVESGQQAWSAPQIYREGGNNGVWTGELGMLDGVVIVENANQQVLANAGAGGTVEVYINTFVGRQALGEAVGEAQHLVVAGPFDDLQRFISIGWYGLLGLGIVRQESLLRIESSSSLATNV
jgi:N4-gp56 family major capsid protein